MKNKLFFLVLVGLFIVGNANAQKKKHAKKVLLKGVVLDTENKPIQKASIFVDGKNRKILSDENGRFELKVRSNAKTITVFTITQGATEMAYKGEKEIIFIIKAVDNIEEDPLNAPDLEVNDLINTGYIKAHKRNLTTNVREINRNTIKNAHHYVSIYDMIQGEVAGVIISGNTIRIRGIGSLSGNTTPLFIVNGMPVSSFDHISPSQVKSISILKDSSAAIYGVRGANGVIVITLKTTVYD